MHCFRSILFTIAGLTATANVVAESHNASKPSGETIFEAHCANCHTGGFGGFFTGAPKVGDEDDWETLIPKGADAMTATTLAGIGKMKPRGECDTCTDEEIRAAVEYMMEKSQ